MQRQLKLEIKLWQNLQFKLWQSSTTLVFTRPININWNKTEEKTDIEKKKKNSKYYNTKYCDKKISGLKI